MKGRMIERDVRRGWGSTLSLCNKSLAGFWVPGCSELGNKVSRDSQEGGDHLI